MGVTTSGVRAHDVTVASAEATRQTAVAAAGSSQAAVRNAEITFYRAALASAKTNGISPAVFIDALRELGVSP